MRKWLAIAQRDVPQRFTRVERDEPYIATLAKAVDAFNEELDALVASVRGYRRAA